MKEDEKDGTEISFRVSKLNADAKKSVRDALKAALDAEIKKGGMGSVTADHSSGHSSGHSSAPDMA